MKKIFLVLLIAVYTTANCQHMDSTKVYNNKLKFSLVNFVDNTLFLSYERTMKNGNAWFIGCGPLYSNSNSEPKSGLRSELQYKLYITEKIKENSIKRIYFAPYLTYKYLEKTSTVWNGFASSKVKNTYHSFCPGIVAGYSITVYNRINIDFYLGGGLKRTFDGDFNGHIDYDNGNIWSPGYSGVIPKVGFDVGITF